MILTDKVISDLYDETDKRIRAPLQIYIAEWFLKKFGSKEIAEALLKDFLISIKRYSALHERFRLFCEFSNMD
jgi:hypothetical protein